MKHTYRITSTLIITLGLTLQTQAANWYPIQTVCDYLWPAQCEELPLLNTGAVLAPYCQNAIKHFEYDSEFLLAMAVKIDNDLKIACKHADASTIRTFNALRKEIREAYKNLDARPCRVDERTQTALHNIMSVLINKAVVTLNEDPSYFQSQAGNKVTYMAETEI